MAQAEMEKTATSKRRENLHIKTSFLKHLTNATTLSMYGIPASREPVTFATRGEGNNAVRNG